jgi:hypothetical protein
MTVNMVTLLESQSGRSKLTTPKNVAFGIVLATKPEKLWLFWGAYMVQNFKDGAFMGGHTRSRGAISF